MKPFVEAKRFEEFVLYCIWERRTAKYHIVDESFRWFFIFRQFLVSYMMYDQSIMLFRSSYKRYRLRKMRHLEDFEHIMQQKCHALMIATKEISRLAVLFIPWCAWLKTSWFDLSAIDVIAYLVGAFSQLLQWLAFLSVSPWMVLFLCTMYTFTKNT